MRYTQNLNGVEVDMTAAEIEELEAARIQPPPTVMDYRREIQFRIDAKAQERGYDGGQTIATYVASTVEPWAAEAQAFVAWRDAVWVYAYSELAKVENGDREPPTPEEFCEELPLLTWPA